MPYELKGELSFYSSQLNPSSTTGHYNRFAKRRMNSCTFIKDLKKNPGFS